MAALLKADTEINPWGCAVSVCTGSVELSGLSAISVAGGGKRCRVVVPEDPTAPYFGQGQPLACKPPVFWVFSLPTPLGHQALCQSGTLQLLVTECKTAVA